MRILVAVVGLHCMAFAVHAQGPGATWPTQATPAGAPVPEPAGWVPGDPAGMPMAAPDGSGASMMEGTSYPDGNQEYFPTPDMSQAPPIPPSWVAGLWNPQPILEFRAEVMFLSPNMQPSVPIANTFVLNADRLAYIQQPIEVGVKETFVTSGRLAAEYHLNHFHSFDIGGFISDGPNISDGRVGPQDSTYFLDADNDSNLQRGYLFNIPENFPTIADRLRIDWTFESFGGEVNYWRHFIPVRGPYSDLAVGLGIRYFAFRDRTNLTVADEINNLTGQMNVDSKNDMLGPQLTARATVPTVFSKRLRVFAEGKIGLMANKTSSTTFLDSTGFGRGTTYDRTNFSPLIEGNFRVEFYVFEHMTLYGGCVLFYTDRVDRASGQYTQNLQDFVVEHKQLGSLFSFGPTAGVLFQY